MAARRRFGELPRPTRGFALADAARAASFFGLLDRDYYALNRDEEDAIFLELMPRTRWRHGPSSIATGRSARYAFYLALQQAARRQKPEPAAGTFWRLVTDAQRGSEAASAVLHDLFLEKYAIYGRKIADLHAYAGSRDLPGELWLDPLRLFMAEQSNGNKREIHLDHAFIPRAGAPRAMPFHWVLLHEIGARGDE